MATGGTARVVADGPMITSRPVRPATLPSVIAVAVLVSLTGCTGANTPKAAVDPSRPTASSGVTANSGVASAGVAATGGATATQPGTAVAELGRSAGCVRVTAFTPTKPASQGAFCSFADGVTLNLLVFANASDRDAVLKFNYSSTHVNGYGKNWTVLGLYDDLRPTSHRNKTVAADVTRATKRAGGTVLK